MGYRNIVRWAAAAAFVLAAGVTAWAQDYAVSSAGRGTLWVSPPSNAVDLGISGDDSTYLMSSNTPWKNANFPPFPISYYGTNFTTPGQFGFSTNGFMQIGGKISSGCCSAFVGGTPPYASSNSYDGFISMAWTDLHSGSAGGKVYAWTDGTYPNRRFIVAYTNWSTYSSQSNGSLNFQVQFYESDSTYPGRIVIAYSSTGWSASGSFGVGIDEYAGATRFNRPPAPGSTSGTYTFATSPPNDWIFDPKITTFTGTVLMDKYVVDGTGIGNTRELGQPASGLSVQLRDSSGSVAGSGTTNGAGAFNLRGIALVGAQTGTLWVTGSTPACAVRATTGGAALGFQLASNVSFASDLNVGTLSITEANDPGGTNRAPLNIASTIQGVYDWCSTRTTKTIPFLEVLYGPYTTAYSKPGATAAQMLVAASGADPDGWDRSVIRRTYARHVLGAVSGYPTTPFDNTYDKATDDANAFAEGFGYYLHFAVSGDSQVFYDGLGPSTANATNVEEPATPLTTSPASNVAAWCALALYDLLDPANEAWDTVDGTGAFADRPFRTVAAMNAAPTASTFCTQWGSAPLVYDGVGLSSGFIRHGLLTDDADEPNDLLASARAVTQFGFIRTGRVLNLYNEDWYSFVMPQPTNKLTAVLTYNRTAYNTTTLIELRNAANAVLAVGTSPNATDPFTAITGALPAGTYYIRVKHSGGVRLPNYDVSAFAELAFSAAALAPWTVGRPVNLPVNIKGGIPPYTLSVEAPFEKPPGLILDGVNARVTGVPSEAGFFPFVLSASDSANPKNFAAGPQTFLVNPVLELKFGEFMALALDKDMSTRGAYVGGTAPYTTTLDSGELPSGVVIDPLDIRFNGHPDTAGAYPIALTGTDVAGSAASQPVTAVVCAGTGSTVNLAAGRSACGFYFDGVKGSIVGVTVKTASGMPRRALRVQVLDADGVTALDAKTKGGKGSAKLTKFVAPSTGRFFMVVASDEGDATQLVGTVKVTPTKKGSGDNPDRNFVAGKQFTVRLGALAGARLTFTARPDGGGLALKPIYLIDPNGAIVLVGETELKSARGAFTITKTLGVSGTWQVLIGALPGPQGHFKYSYKLAEPKDVVYQLD